MKKKLEAELISIAHRILKLKNRAELDQLQQETLKLYQKLSVLKFVEDNFSDIKPTIGYASAEGKLEEVYGIEETPEVKANEAEAEKAHDEKKETAPEEDKENTAGESTAEPKAEEKQETPVAPAEETEVAEPAKEAAVAEEAKTEAPEVDAQPEEDKENKSGEGVDTDSNDGAQIAEEEKKEDAKAEPAKEVKAAKVIIDAEVGLHPEEEIAITPEPEMPAIGNLPENDGEDKDNGTGEGIDLPSGKPTVSEEEKDYTKGTDAGQTGFDFNFEKKLEDDFKPNQVSLEDFKDYKEPEFVKKDSLAKPTETVTTDDWRNWEPAKTATEAPKAEEPKADPTSLPLRDWRDWEPKGTTTETPKEPEAAKPAEPVRDWRDWEPAKTPEPAAPVTLEPSKPAPVAAAPKFNDGFVRALNLGLNDRIAFEKNLFGGSSEDLNRVVSQLNTLNSFDEAKDFITDLVKPDYNNWAGKEEYEERFMQLVEKKFS